MRHKTRRINNKEEEYRFFLEDHLLPLMGMHLDEPEDLVPTFAIERENSYNVIQDKTKGILYFLIDKRPFFKLHTENEIPQDNIRLARTIITSFRKVSHFNFSDSGPSIQHEYLSDALREKSYEYAVQHGICTWITGNTKSTAVDRLLRILERWSVQTYEGRKVTFGFVIDPKGEGKFNWLEFLEDDYSATLTDCINSVVELDVEGRLIGYRSLEQGEVSLSTEYGKRPYRFSDVLRNFVNRDKVGVFLLNNGDIIISKRGEVMFVKRNLVWLNLSYAAFRNVLAPAWDQSCSAEAESVIENVYASTLDVSFAHTGGIIAIVTDISSIAKNEKGEGILSRSDNITDAENTEEELNQLQSDLKQFEGVEGIDLEKRLLKRRAILSLMKGSSFCALDRKLRAELIAMDGAFIMSPEGKIFAIGAIIQNQSGSSGGGRGAACRRLSRDGVAIKISTDGYIEVYFRENLIYSVK